MFIYVSKWVCGFCGLVLAKTLNSKINWICFWLFTVVETLQHYCQYPPVLLFPLGIRTPFGQYTCFLKVNRLFSVSGDCSQSWGLKRFKISPNFEGTALCQSSKTSLINMVVLYSSQKRGGISLKTVLKNIIQLQLIIFSFSQFLVVDTLQLKTTQLCKKNPEGSQWVGCSWGTVVNGWFTGSSKWLEDFEMLWTFLGARFHH